jgi:hypothetical protein
MSTIIIINYQEFLKVFASETCLVKWKGKGKFGIELSVLNKAFQIRR